MKRNKPTKRQRQAEQALAAAEHRAALSERRMRMARRSLKTASNRYAAARPLTVAEREEIAVAVAGGRGICCKSGLIWLRRRLPKPWAHALNEWAYSYLGCKGQQNYLEDNANRVRRLDLKKLPRIY